MSIDNMLNRYWRLNNLYSIINEDGKSVKFKMRQVQDNLYRNMSFRNIILKARQLGNTSFIDLLCLDICLFTPNIRAGIIAHTKPDARAIFHDKIWFPYNSLPDNIRKSIPLVKSESSELRMINNSSIRVGTSFRSATSQFLHISEYGKICAMYPKKAREILTGCIPTVHAGSFLFIEGTAEGRSGHFFDMCEASRLGRTDGGGQELQFHFFPWWMNRSYRLSSKGVEFPDRIAKYFIALEKLGIVLDAEQRAWYRVTEGGSAGLGEDMKREHPSYPEEAFAQAIEGAYYKSQLDRAYGEERITHVVYNPAYPVDTSWDIGHSDSTAIWFSQDIGGKLYLIDYYESSQEGLEHYVEVLRDKQAKLKYKYGRMIGPHDIRVTEWGSGKTRLEQALSHGLMFEIAPSIGLLDGIEVTRRMLNECWFDATRCDQGIKALSSYRKEWNDNTGDWSSKPLKDWTNHGSDSLRYLAISRSPGSTVRSGVRSNVEKAMYKPVK